MTPAWRTRDDGPYVIAEIGVNHDGSLHRALELVDMASEAGADAVKTQFFRADLLLGASAGLTSAQRKSGEADAPSMLRRLELRLEELGEIAARARARGLDPIVTVFSVELVEQAERIAWAAYKTASPDIVHEPLLEALAATGKPLILSTGASEPREIERALVWLHAARERIALLHCVSCYPTPAHEAALGAIGAMRDFFGAHIDLGYSDHTVETDTGGIARRCGARILEKHLTYDRSAKGPDHAASLDPAQFAHYVQRSREGGRFDASDPRIGAREKVVLACEREVRRLCRQSIVAARRIDAGETIRRDALTFQRPGDGLAAWRAGELVGQTACETFEAGEALRLPTPAGASA